MIYGDDFFGWGVFKIPISRDKIGKPSTLPAGSPIADLGRHLIHDPPWRAMLFSVLTACLILYSIALLHRTLPPVGLLEPPEVEVTVRLPEEVREIPQPPVVKPQPVPKKAPPPVPQKVVRTKPAPTPKAKPIQQAPPAEVALPKPSPMVPPMPERRAETRSELPVRKSERIAEPEPSLPVATSLSSNYDSKPQKAAEVLSPRKTDIRGTAPSEESIVKTTPVRVAPRGPAKEALPGGTKVAKVALGGPADDKLSPVNTGISSRHYDTPSAGQQLSPKAGKGTVATNQGEEAEVDSPASGVGSALGKRAPDAQGPSAGPAKTAFAGVGTGSEERLSGPAATVQKAGAQQADTLPAGGYDFLDKVGQGNLDPSVMVSLNRLRTCRDPGEEMRLRTRLASMLSRPALCRSGGCIFDITHQESAYSIHIDLYNYEKRDFKDRCEALSLAVNSCEARRLNR